MQNKEQVLFSIYEQVKTLTETHHFGQDEFQKIVARFEEKKQNPEISIMVYGVYNAGKSTFINALIGQELAAMGDIPLTDKVSAYSYQNYKILDTPGIDAPKKHEEVADAQLLKSDVILFIVNPLGVIEEQATLDKLMDLFKKNKKVFLIFNEKNELSEADFVKLKDQTRQRLQTIAQDLGLKDDILGDIPIHKINAKRALKGKLDQKKNMVKLSGIHEIEYALNEFINGILERDEIHKSLKSILLNFIDNSIQQMEQSNSGELEKLYKKLSDNIVIQKAQLRKNIKGSIKDRAQILQKDIQSWLLDENRNLDQQYKNRVEKELEYLGQEIQDAFEEIGNQIKIDIDNLEIQMPKNTISSLNTSIDTSKIDNVKTSGAQPNIPENDIVKDVLSNSGKALQLAKPEHLVSVLKVIKTYFPSLMSGIGPATMGKIATTFLSRATPVIAAASVIYDLWGAQSESKKIEEANLQMWRDMERRNAQIADTARQVADDFNITISKNFVQMIDEFFEQFTNYLDEGRHAFSQQEQERMALLTKLKTLQQALL